MSKVYSSKQQIERILLERGFLQYHDPERSHGQHGFFVKSVSGNSCTILYRHAAVISVEELGVLRDAKLHAYAKSLTDESIQTQEVREGSLLIELSCSSSYRAPYRKGAKAS